MWECVCVSMCVSPSSSFCFCLCCRLWISLSSCKASWDKGRNSGEEEVGSEGWLLRVTIDNKQEQQQQQQQQYVLVGWSRQAPPLQLCHWGDETSLLVTMAIISMFILFRRGWRAAHCFWSLNRTPGWRSAADDPAQDPPLGSIGRILELVKKYTKVNWICPSGRFAVIMN